MKDLPRMYHNRINKEITNNEKVYNSMSDNGINVKKTNDSNIDSRYNIEKKIYNIFNSPDYIYKVDVTIVTDNGMMNKRIVGKNRNNLITIDNEYIPISSILDIYRNN